MPLLVPTLQKPLEALFTKGSVSAAQSAEIMANAYVSYVSTAIFGATIPLFLGNEVQLLKATILAVLNPALMNPAGLGNAWSAGIQAFWLAPPIACVGPTPGNVTSVPGAPSLVGTLLAICSVPGQPAAVAAAAMAAAIHAATATTIATLTISGVPTPVPIS